MMPVAGDNRETRAKLSSADDIRFRLVEAAVPTARGSTHFAEMPIPTWIVTGSPAVAVASRPTWMAARIRQASSLGEGPPVDQKLLNEAAQVIPEVASGVRFSVSPPSIASGVPSISQQSALTVSRDPSGLGVLSFSQRRPKRPDSPGERPYASFDVATANQLIGDG